MTSPRIRQLLASLAFGAVLACHLLLFTPLTLYLGNSDEFAVDFFTMLPHFVRVAVLLSVLFGLIGMLVPERAQRAYVAVIAMLSLLVWVQGNFLVWDYGPLDGRQIDWSQGVWRGWVDLAVWLLALGVAGRLAPTPRKLLLSTALVVFSLQLVTGVVLGMRDSSRLLRDDSLVSRSATLKQLHAFSRKNNVLHLIMDGFQADIFEEITGDAQRGQQIADALDGFVFYRNNLSAFPFTHMSLPAILSGKIYKNEVPIKTFRKQAFGEKNILNTVYDAGYEVDVASLAVLVNMFRLARHTNAYNVPRNLHVGAKQSELDEAAKLLDLTLFRSMPHFVKQGVYNDQRWFVQPMINDSDLMQLDFFSHNLFLQRWRESMTATRDAPVYKLFHLMLSHNPMVVTNDCQFAKQILPTVRANVLNQARCSLLETVRVLNKMKELGVYDDALIVLMGDHGAWVGPKGMKAELGPDAKPKAWLLEAHQYALALPLLAIKLPGAHGALQISNVPTWTADVPDTISAVLGLDESFGRRNILTLSPGEKRERNHYIYRYDRSEWEADYLLPIQEYTVDGDFYDGASWRLGEYYPPNTKAE